jgi:hypothetical protein
MDKQTKKFFVAKIEESYIIKWPKFAKNLNPLK